MQQKKFRTGLPAEPAIKTHFVFDIFLNKILIKLSSSSIERTGQQKPQKKKEKVLVPQITRTQGLLSTISMHETTGMKSNVVLLLFNSSNNRHVHKLNDNHHEQR